MAKDFFDEEYKKTERDEEQSQATWFDRAAPTQVGPKSYKRLYTVLMCFALVVCIGFGWLLCYVVNLASTPQEEKVLATVIDYLHNKYYKDIPDEQWTKAVELSGTALMQYAGDRFSMLMSPQTYYNFDHPLSSVSQNGLWGLSLTIDEGVGLHVTYVTPNSNAYGKFVAGDTILMLTDIVGINGVPTVGEEHFEQIDLSKWARTTVEAVLNQVKSATFHVLRLEGEGSSAEYTLLKIPLERGIIKPVNSDYDYKFIEFYFSDTCRNISVPSVKDEDGNYILTPGEYTTYEERSLDKLPPKTGYVRITEFSDYLLLDAEGNLQYDKDKKVLKRSASKEFREVMLKFDELGLKHLVLDLKGNPGGTIQYVMEIAAMLITDDKLIGLDKVTVQGTGINAGKLLITSLQMPKPASIVQKYYQESSYYKYFGERGDTCDIVVWTDANSASASELLTGALLDYGTAVQMGVKTYGKGIAQTWEELPFTGKVKDLKGNTIDYPWAIYYTCARYYSPLGVNIDGVGYKPQGQYNNLTRYDALWDAATQYWE